MKLIIAGGRTYNFTAEDMLWLTETFKGKVTEVVSGKARGADTWGEHWAKQNMLPVKGFPADWEKFGQYAGHKRNKEMANYADWVVLFPGGRGTANMFKEAIKAGLKIWDKRF